MRQSGLDFLSEALLMDDLGAFLVILLFGDPHGLKLLDTGNDGSSQPAAVFTVGWRLNLWNHGGWCQSLYLLLHSLLHSAKHCASTSQYNILEQVSSNIDVTLCNGRESMLVNTFLH